MMFRTGCKLTMMRGKNATCISNRRKNSAAASAAPYLARAKWVYVEDAKALGDEEAAQLLRRSYELVFGKLTKKLQREIGGV